MERVPASTHRRTVEEAIAQADAKERIRDARAMRAGSVTVLVVGLYLLALRSPRPDHQVLRVHIHGGASFMLSSSIIFGTLAVVASPIVFVIGSLRLRRARAAAARDPVTAPVLGQRIS